MVPPSGKVDELTTFPFLPLDLIGGTSAVVSGDVVAAEGHSSRAVQLLTLEDIEVHWHPAQVRLVDGELHAQPESTDGDTLVTRAWQRHTYEVGERYYLFLIADIGIEVPGSQWLSFFALTVSGQEPVAGVEDETIAELHAILEPGELPATHAFEALLEFVIEGHEFRDVANEGLPEPEVGPRTERLFAYRDPPQPDPLSEWLALLPHQRPLTDEIPEGADAALGVEWTHAPVLVAHGTYEGDDRKRVVLATPHGRGVSWVLNPDGVATLIPLFRAAGAWVAVVEPLSDGSISPVLTPHMGLTPSLEWAVPELDDGKRLFVDLRGPVPEAEVLEEADFDDLVLELRP